MPATCFKGCSTAAWFSYRVDHRNATLRLTETRGTLALAPFASGAARSLQADVFISSTTFQHMSTGSDYTIEDCTYATE